MCDNKAPEAGESADVAVFWGAAGSVSQVLAKVPRHKGTGRRRMRTEGQTESVDRRLK